MLKESILIVEDDEIFREFLSEALKFVGYKIIGAEDGRHALEVIERHHRSIDLILLDREMPFLNGIEVLRQLKANPAFANIPVVMQTRADSDDDIIVGIEAGAYYYLTKPYNADVLIPIVRAALDDQKRHQLLKDEVRKNSTAISLMDFGSFSFRDPLSAQHLATLLALMCPEPETVVIGLGELMINAIEHGNLAIDYARKGELIENNKWAAEIVKRLELSEHKAKQVAVTVAKSAGKLEIRISDQGQGFNWRDYIDLEPHRARGLHGRGIALATRLSFTSLSYEDNGATAIATINL